jgi:serine/threonine protein kinase
VRDCYTIGKTLGKGSFGEVKEATHNKTGLKRAVKFIKKEDLDSDEQEALLNEV